ncbi:MAG TPA: hypothetical protein P5087_00730 [Eubacteriales bacterium]|nr:hypothetical protein [Eubacteriales bacterium]
MIYENMMAKNEKNMLEFYKSVYWDFKVNLLFIIPMALCVFLAVYNGLLSQYDGIADLAIIACFLLFIIIYRPFGIVRTEMKTYGTRMVKVQFLIIT